MTTTELKVIQEKLEKALREIEWGWDGLSQRGLVLDTIDEVFDDFILDSEFDELTKKYEQSQQEV